MNSLLLRAVARSVTRPHAPPTLTTPCVAGPSNHRHAVRHASNKSGKPKEPPRRPRDKEIRFPIVRLVNPETGTLEEPVPLKELLAHVAALNAAGGVALDGSASQKKNRHFLELVAAEPEPIVKLESTLRAYARQQALRERKREQPRARDEKEIQLTWGVADADLQHKLDKARAELLKGNRVSLVYTRKKDQAVRLTPEEMVARATEVVEGLADAGAEWKPRESSRGTTIIYLQGHNLPPPRPIQTQERQKQHNLSRVKRNPKSEQQLDS